MPTVKIYMELTYRCNLKCKFCYVGDMQTEKHQFFENQDIEGIKKNIDKIFIDGVDCDYNIDILGGESLINPYFFDIIKYISDKHSVPRFTLTTNATFLSEDTVQKLKESGINELRISIHGLEKDHNDIVGKPVFNKVLEGLTQLKKYNIEYTLIYVYNKINRNKLLELLELLADKKIFPTSVFVEFVEFSGYALDAIEELNLEYDSELKNEINFLIGKIKRDYGMNTSLSNIPKCMLESEHHHLIDDTFHEDHRYELYYPGLARKSLFGFSNVEQRKIIKQNLKNGFKINFQERLDDKYIPKNCVSCSFNKNCYLLTKESILYEYLGKEYLKRKHYFEINKNILGNEKNKK